MQDEHAEGLEARKVEPPESRGNAAHDGEIERQERNARESGREAIAGDRQAKDQAEERARKREPQGHRRRDGARLTGIPKYTQHQHYIGDLSLACKQSLRL